MLPFPHRPTTDYGYTRVSVGSVGDNTLADQRLVLGDVYGILDENLFTDIASGGDFQRRQGLVPLLDARRGGNKPHLTLVTELEPQKDIAVYGSYEEGLSAGESTCRAAWVEGEGFPKEVVPT